MKYLALLLLLSIVGAHSMSSADGLTSAESARAEVAPLLAEMGEAANAHDVKRHVGFYAHDPSVMLIFDGESIVGWDAIFDKQREWWQDGKTDVVYTMQGKPDFRMPAPARRAGESSILTNRRLIKSPAVGESRKVRPGLWRLRVRGGHLSGGWRCASLIDS
jgi:hypothetical protein